MSSPRLQEHAKRNRSPLEARIARIFKLTKAAKAQGANTIQVRVADLEALTIAAAVRQTIGGGK